MPAPTIPNNSLELHRVTKLVRLAGSVRLGWFDVGVCLVKLVFIEKQLDQEVVSPE